MVKQKFMAYQKTKSESECLYLLLRHWFGENKIQVRVLKESWMGSHYYLVWDFDPSIWQDVLELFPELRFEAPLEIQSVVRTCLKECLVPDLTKICLQYMFTSVS